MTDQWFLHQDIVKLEPIQDDYLKIKISWDTVPGASQYNVYGSFVETNKNLLDQTNNNYYIVDLPFVPLDLVCFFWVSYMQGSTEVFIQEEPATLYGQKNLFLDENNPLTGDSDIYIPNYMMSYYLAEMRTRHKAILENDGEDFYLYKRRWTGNPCSCVPGTKTALGDDPDLNMDSDYDGSGRCELCYGTGIFGGYFPKIKIKIRYGEIPSHVIRFAHQNLILDHTFNSWTLWAPKINTQDVLVRASTNERFNVSDVGQSEWRNVPLHQKLQLKSLPATDIRYKLSDEHIQNALVEGSRFGNARFNLAIWQ